ncbi:hypothetical protein D2T29_05800 [Sinirhodobacter populi]|uniref:O-antigen ligase domain-containing protein n=1 Tax=Paenirhodobacter populi TaxID=2306993 RepID=A0A443KLY8_9RHOB|nr:hypothetical protein [Sinirhodobacter populi]RWR33775.1 hypothetical protein D2T29_05800 [Sinirhodobacter populi]
MSIEPIGLFVIGIGLLCLFADYRNVLVLTIFATVFGAASAMFLGSGNIPPGHVLLGLCAVAILSRKESCTAFLRVLHPDRPGFWLASLVIYAVATAFLYPRVMASWTEIVPLGSTEFDSAGSTVPLGPVSGNITQSIYMIANLLCFALVAAAAASPAGFRAAVAGLLAYAIGNTFFAVMDLATYFTGTADLMGFMRNARYTLHTEAEAEGLKRIVGAFTEASSFARSSLGVLGVTGTLWLCGYKPRLTGVLALASLVLTALSTSSTGLAGIPVALGLLYLTALSRCGTAPRAWFSTAAVMAIPLIALLLTLTLLLQPAILAELHGYFDRILLSKMDTDSGVERSSWNSYAIGNFFDTAGIGVGLGTIRSSSLLTGLLGGVGVIGTALYAVFFATAFLRNPGPKGSFPTDVRTAARNGCLCLMAGDLMVATTIDQGLFFYVLAGIAAARPEEAAAPSRASAGVSTQGGIVA